MKFKFTLLWFTFLLASFLNQLSAQSLTITGKVFNKSSGEVLVGSTVSVEGSTKSVLTDVNGVFKISASKGSVLIISYVGLTTQKQKIGTTTQFIFLLESNAASKLDEVVVIGYGTQKLTKVSGSISTVKADVIDRLKPVRMEEALQGNSSGVTVIQSGSPGASPTILIRGIPSYTGNGPLVIIDGAQQTQNDLNSINPADIESISVLKDAASAAIYGVSGGNGVLVVTTGCNPRKRQKK